MACLLVVVVHPTDPSGRLGQWLREAGLELDERHLGAGDELPETLDGFGGMVVLGGPQSALDDERTSPELVGVRELLRRALAADFPTLAICLGAQLLAQAGGGRVRTGIDGPEVGALLVAKRDAADDDPVFRPCR
ncbi:glutamine amidotransferase-related protein [Blastococcus brunescens]|uniref:Gamma-glutamyl-gamma-aminobutyrate hydrolase family protein n=1 Tax=Blastococcus brunescens TaxID=1564165 RepID=A0ABZ1B554_9ACTN|nr:gamma-glutamyl-gamma-aminobutyrate hydrolase family protein [Blastococcus sp. BMG 8361]WRL65864.1 gamma-glutamyl-gamma-aminobutyrate hydrolase family protein [Blastococcus sp. BMG 8361]